MNDSNVASIQIFRTILRTAHGVVVPVVNVPAYGQRRAVAGEVVAVQIAKSSISGRKGTIVLPWRGFARSTCLWATRGLESGGASITVDVPSAVAARSSS